MTNYERLVEFHRAVNGSISKRPSTPDSDMLELRETLIHEEYKEVTEELRILAQGVERNENASINKVVHELIDLLYVTYGTLVEFGVNADEVFAEVHRANMRKLDGPKRSDGKQLKPEGWQAADVAGVLERQHRR